MISLGPQRSMTENLNTQIPQIQQMLKSCKLKSGVLMAPPKKVNVANIGAASNGAVLNSAATGGPSRVSPFTSSDPNLSPGSMAVVDRTITLEGKHFQAMLNGTCVLNYEKAMAPGLRQIRTVTAPDAPALPVAQTNSLLNGRQNINLSQAVFLDYGPDTAANARELISLIWGLPLVAGSGLQADPDTAGPSVLGPQVGSTALLRILCDPGSSNTDVATGTARSTAYPAVGVATDAQLNQGNGNSSRMTCGVSAVTNGALPTNAGNSAAYRMRPTYDKLIQMAYDPSKTAAGVLNPAAISPTAYSARVVWGAMSYFNSNITPNVAGNPTSQGTHVIWDCDGVADVGTRNIVSVGGEDAAAASVDCIVPMGMNGLASTAALQLNSMYQIAAAGGGGTSQGTNASDTQGSRPISQSEVVIAASVISLAEGQEKVMFSLLQDVNCAGSNSPLLNYTYPI